MDILEGLKKEHSKKQTDRIVRYIGADKKRFAMLIELFFKGEYRITQRAAWPLSYCVRAHPELIQPYFKPLLDNLGRKDIHIAVVRNTVRLLQDVAIPKKHQGRVMSICFDLIQSPETPIAVKAFSLTILSHLAADYPDIRGELKLIIEEQWEHSTPAFRSRAKKVLKAMESLPQSSQD
ncbi:hypothetical protein [Puia dinghuensis]|uniref:Uncharacterized protein n=1 Tax=Puia dinghuensis TaxID=1792502 RepID=A0A8J2U807_9BACT|nr:hypothetical protein [Puia dinghuensis]GGA85187.1 hypothetical protein GCM10011511_05280 [Puia dinghuensis]